MPSLSPLGLRLVTALWGVPLILGVVWLGGWLYGVLVAALGLASLYELVQLTQKKGVWFWLAGVYVTAACACLLALPSMALPQVFGADFPLVIALITLVWVNDTVAYVGGKAIGGARLMPAISPNKTWAGLMVSLVVTTAYGAAFIVWWTQEVSWAVALMVAFGASVVAHVGDAGESLYKRWAGVKDSGAWLPGHGGILDRFDSLYAVALVSFVVLTSLR
ncbi:MAG: phosphatidate cytidylyltransferase [Alphaproteobacteria bacterium GM202ARS2]|nr:phosphatidate cytidylyltransferase [Alphaproteobacteria bacterium GM202ARS2]